MVKSEEVTFFRCVKCFEVFNTIQEAHKHYTENTIEVTTDSFASYKEAHFFEEWRGYKVTP